MSGRRWGITSASYLVACLLLGGASAAGAAVNATLQLLAIIILLLLVWSRGTGSLPVGARPLLLIGAALLAWVLAQLIPLPQELWSSLPGRDSVAQGFSMLGIDDVAIPMSLAPDRTIESTLWLLPPVAAFFLVLWLPTAQRRWLAMAVIAVAVISVSLGALQVLEGDDSQLRFYEITNPSAPVGFFANKNHLATLLLCTLPLIAALAGRSASAGSEKRAGGARIIYISLVLFIAIGVLINGSMAGYGLLLPTLAGSILVYQRAVRGKLSRRAMLPLGVLLVGFIGLSILGPLGNEALSTKLNNNPSSRKVLTARTIEAAGDFFPVGSGLGSFQQVYRRYEDPAEARRSFANHAHNDYAEVALELGLPGMVLVLLFLLWWIRRTISIWRGSFGGANLARAASVLIGAVLFHSLVDYPLRTSAIAAIFAAACALMLQGPSDQVKSRSDSEGEGGKKRARHLQAD